jgi:hypothetical protein
MSEHTAIRAVSQSLRALLETHITLAGVNVVLHSPREMQQNGETGISVWLYRITRNEHVLNQPRVRVAANQFEHHSLPVNLHYLITPIRSDPLDEQLLLGRILQIFNDVPVLRGANLTDALAGSEEEFRIFLEMLSLEELTRIWGALQEPYQTSLSYLVQMVDITSGLTPERREPVMNRSATYSQIVSPG